MALASGTSTPTSTTVVETRIGAWPSAKRAMAAAFSSAGSRPCMTSRPIPEVAGRSRSMAAVSDTEARGAPAASSSIFGQTT